MKNKHSRIWAAVFMSILIAVSTVLTAVGHIDKAQAAEKAVLQISTVSGHRGDEVSVTVSLTSNPGIAGLVFSLTFNNKVLKLVDVKEPANTDDEFIFYEPIIKDDAIMIQASIILVMLLHLANQILQRQVSCIQLHLKY